MNKLIFNFKHIVKIIIFKIDVFSKFNSFNSFPFYVNKPLSSNKYNLLEETINILNKLNVNYRLTDGTILGIYRDKKLIDHDNDIDIDILNDSNCDFIQIQKKFKAKGFILGRIVFCNSKIQQIVFYNKSKDLVDLLFWQIENNTIYNYSEKNFVRKQDIKYFKRLSQIEFNNCIVMAPGYLEEWLELRYGKDWKTPKTFKGDWKLECFDMQSL